MTGTDADCTASTQQLTYLEHRSHKYLIVLIHTPDYNVHHLTVHLVVMQWLCRGQ